MERVAGRVAGASAELETGRRAGPATGAWSLVALGVLGVSVSGPIAAVTVVPALAVAFWRTALGALATGPVAIWTARRSGGRLRPGWAVLAGGLLAVHFGTWIPSLRLTSVTASTALVTAAPLWIVLIERLTGAPRPPRAVLVGVLASVGGVLVVTGVDAGHGGTAPAGDLLALLGGAAGAGYVLVGERVRRTTSTPVYTALAYGSCALLLAPVCLLGGVRLCGWPARGWLDVAVLTVAAQLLGHSAFNAALPVVGATPLSLAILLEVPGAALVAWAWWGQRPPIGVLPGVALVLVGLVLVLRARGASHAGAS
jgi:drug/metabolite transporter (DMT)-like permease